MAERGRREDVDLYVRTYTTVLRTSGEVHLRAFEREGLGIGPGDWQRLCTALSETLWTTLRRVAAVERHRGALAWRHGRWLCAAPSASPVELPRADRAGSSPRISSRAWLTCRPRRASDAAIINIDHPLGMGAYHILPQVAESVDRLAGVCVLGGGGVPGSVVRGHSGVPPSAIR